MRSLFVALLAVLALAAPAAAADHEPVRFWSVSKLVKYVDDGRVVFNLPLHAPYWSFLPRDRAFGSVFSNGTGKLAQAPALNPYRIGSPNGTSTGSRRTRSATATRR
jgi:hypothetical protein